MDAASGSAPTAASTANPPNTNTSSITSATSTTTTSTSSVSASAGASTTAPPTTSFAATTATASTTLTSSVSVASTTSSVAAPPPTVVAVGGQVQVPSSPLLLPGAGPPPMPAVVASSVLSLPHIVQQSQLQQSLQAIEDANNSSMASGISETQRSLSAAPSASSSPMLSPPGKIFGRNANGTMVATSRPNNEAETQLYRVLQRASLLVYYDTLLEMGGDDVQQLYEAGEEEFLEIMALVGMASKPLHVRRLQKALHEWANNPQLFQGPISSSTPGLFDTPTKSPAVLVKPEPSRSPSFARNKFPSFTTTPAFSPTPLATTSSSHLITQLCTPAITVPVIQPHTPLPLASANLPAAAATPPAPQMASGCTITAATVAAAAATPTGVGTTHHVSSSSPQLTPVLTDMQVVRITQGAEKIARQLPQREPRAQTSKKRTTRELEQVIAMHESDPRRMDEIRKYSAIYGRFDCKRRPEKPLTLHEVCVNEAAAQLCRLVPALLTRRDELFPLARQIVKDAGFGHSASIARYGGLLPQVMQAQQVVPRSTVMVDCESSDSMASASSKRQRLSSTETAAAPDLGLSRESNDDTRYNLFAMYQKFAKPPFDLTDISKFSLSKSEYDDHENDNDSRLSFSNSSSPSMPPSCLENERDLSDVAKFKALTTYSATTSISSSTVAHTTDHPMDTNNHNRISPNQQLQQQQQLRSQTKYNTVSVADSAVAAISGAVLSGSALGDVQVISAAGGHIIAVANPALALSPTLNEALSLKREANSPEL